MCVSFGFLSTQKVLCFIKYSTVINEGIKYQFRGLNCVSHLYPYFEVLNPRNLEESYL